MSAFAGFPAGCFSWFAGLERDNSRAYMTATRETYDRDVRGALEALLDELAPRFGGAVHVFRQHRDVRFSADKSPYKTRTYGVVSGAAGSAAGFYAEVSAAGLFAGTGYHELAGDQLARYRAAVLADATGEPLAGIVHALRDAGLEVFGEALKTAPRGVARDHPRVALLRHRSLFTGRRLAPGPGGIPRAAAVEQVAGTWRAGRDLDAWLDAHVGASRVADPGAGRGRAGRGRPSGARGSPPRPE
jgi:uncharacterized protein (TIGR02453 family)